jgi:hypothetical protein
MTKAERARPIDRANKIAKYCRTANLAKMKIKII